MQYISKTTDPLAIIMGIEQYKAALVTLESVDDNDIERIFWLRKTMTISKKYQVATAPQRKQSIDASTMTGSA